MNVQDGRVVSNFILQALQNKNLTVYGDGKQTRSFQYVSDLVDGLVRLMESDVTEPVNLGNPDEYTILDFAEKIIALSQSESSITHLPATQDDPQRRLPDIARAQAKLGWNPVVHVNQGLEETIQYFANELDRIGQEVQAVKPPKRS